MSFEFLGKLGVICFELRIFLNINLVRYYEEKFGSRGFRELLKVYVFIYKNFLYCFFECDVDYVYVYKVIEYIEEENICFKSMFFGKLEIEKWY